MTLLLNTTCIDRRCYVASINDRRAACQPPMLNHGVSFQVCSLAHPQHFYDAHWSYAQPTPNMIHPGRTTPLEHSQQLPEYRNKIRDVRRNTIVLVIIKKSNVGLLSLKSLMLLLVPCLRLQGAVIAPLAVALCEHAGYRHQCAWCHPPIDGIHAWPASRAASDYNVMAL